MEDNIDSSVEINNIEIIKEKHKLQIKKERKKYNCFISFIGFVFIASIFAQTFLYKGLIKEQNLIIDYKNLDIIEKNKKISQLTKALKENQM